jgi:putative FmdB family regulatory protein
MILNDYDCPTCGTFETWAKDQNISCPACGARARKLIKSKGVLLSFKDEGFPRASRMWAEEHERAARWPI